MKNKGFTLAELLMAVLVISIIMVALAPVMTKRAYENKALSNPADKEGVLFTYDISDNNCTPVSSSTSGNYLECNFKAPEGVENVSVIMSGAGGGGAGAVETKKTKTTMTITSDKTMAIDHDTMSDFIIDYLSGGGGGGGGSYSQKSGLGEPTSQNDCNKYSAYYMSPSTYGNSKGMCITLYNAGDANGPAIPSSITTYNNASPSCGSSDNCCWKGNLSTSCTNASGNTYDACNRTVCTYTAANNICSYMGNGESPKSEWRLPHYSGDLTNLFVNYYGYYDNASNINLCSKSSVNGSSLCSGGYGCVRYGASYGYGECKPYALWSQGGSGGDCCGFEFTGYGSGPVTTYSRGAGALSVRCISDQILKYAKLYAGGGGASAPYIRNYPINEEYIKFSHTLEVKIGRGGKGGDSTTVESNSTSGIGTVVKDGAAGATSYVHFLEPYRVGDIDSYRIAAAGGNGGKKATDAAVGIGGTTSGTLTDDAWSSASYPCYVWVYRTGSYIMTSCSGSGYSGQSGYSNINGYPSPAQGGSGGASRYSSSSNGQGGRGGEANPEYRGTVNVGENGKDGVAQISYNELTPGFGGGGGGGAGFVTISNVSVIPNKTYTVRVGAGGNGGGVNMNGGNGGVTKFFWEGGNFELTGGKGGKAWVYTGGSADTSAEGGAAGGKSSSNATDAEYKAGKAGNRTTVLAEIENRYKGGVAGGRGGESGLGSIGACGGYDNVSPCINWQANARSSTFKAPASMFNSLTQGISGAGGGGGGWDKETNDAGAGGSGSSGFVYIYWTKVK